MRTQHSGVRETKRIVLIGLFLVIVLCFGANDSFAQPADAGHKPKTSSKPKPKPKPKAKPKPTPRPTSSSRPAPKPKTSGRAVSVHGNLRIASNLNGIDVFVFDNNGESVDAVPEFEEGESSAILLRNLNKGTYTVTVKKDGYFESSQNVYVEASKTRTLQFDLRPAMASILIETNVFGATVVIHDSQANQPSKYFLEDSNNRLFQFRPGIYTITISKRGFKTETKGVELQNPGQHLTFVVPLREFTSSELLELADSAFREGDYDAVLEHSDLVLERDRFNGKASMLAGLSYYHRGDTRSGMLLANAIDRGEVFSIPVVVYEKSKTDMLLAGELLFSGSNIEFTSRARGMKSFSLAKDDVKVLRRLEDGNGEPYILMRGKGVFDGKRKSDDIRIYSQNAVLTSTRDRIFCAGCEQSTCKCQMDITSLYEVLFAWRYSK